MSRNVHRRRIEIFILSGLSLSHHVDTKTKFNLNNIIATLSLISISSVKKFVGECPDTYSNLISTPLNGCQSLSIDAQSYSALTSQSLRATIGPLQDNWPLFQYVIGISGILPYNRNVTLQLLELFPPTHGSIMLPPRQPRVFARLARWQKKQHTGYSGKINRIWDI